MNSLFRGRQFYYIVKKLLEPVHNVCMSRSFFPQSVTMRGLTIQVLAAILLSVSLSYSQENGERWEFPKYMVVDKQINVREIIRFGGRQSEEQNEKEFEVPGEAGSRRFSASSLLTMLSNAAKMRKVKNMLPLSGIQWIKDDDIGKAINCGTYMYILCFFKKAYACFMNCAIHCELIHLYLLRKMCLWEKIAASKCMENLKYKLFSGPPGSHINVTWKPRIIDPQKSVEIFFDIVDRKFLYNITVIRCVYMPWNSSTYFSISLTAIDFVKGYADITVYNGGSPIFSLDQDITCQIVAKELPLIKCPIKKGRMYPFYNFDILSMVLDMNEYFLFLFFAYRISKGIFPVQKSVPTKGGSAALNFKSSYISNMKIFGILQISLRVGIHCGDFYFQGSFSIVLKIFSYASKPPPLFSCLNVTVDIKSSANRAVHPTPQVIV